MIQPTEIKPPVPDVAPKREAREKDVLENFEQSRNDAQVQAALGRLAQSDHEGAEELAKEVLKRDVNNFGAREVLAEVYIAQEDIAEAIKQRRELVKLDPQNAEYHLHLGMLLETEGQLPEALQSFDRAIELEPQIELYTSMRDAAISAAKFESLPLAELPLPE